MSNLTIPDPSSSPLPEAPTADIFIPLECDHSYHNAIQILIFLLQAIYVIPGVILNFLVFYTVFFRKKEHYKGNSFFVMFTVDCFISFYLLLGELLTTKAFLFIPPLCEIIGQSLNRSQFMMSLILVVWNHGRAAKSVAQIFLAVNRMTCVLMPASHHAIWKRMGTIGIYFIFLSPFLIVWNLVISKAYVLNAFGGFDLAYSRKVEWASLSQFHLIVVSIALVVTIVCTILTLYGLYILPYRVKSAEKSLCLATITISIGFLFTAAIQFLFAYCKICENSDVLYAISTSCFDVLHVGSPVVMLIISHQLRAHVIVIPRRSKPASISLGPVSERLSS